MRSGMSLLVILGEDMGTRLTKPTSAWIMRSTGSAWTPVQRFRRIVCGIPSIVTGNSSASMRISSAPPEEEEPELGGGQPDKPEQGEQGQKGEQGQQGQQPEQGKGTGSEQSDTEGPAWGEVWEASLEDGTPLTEEECQQALGNLAEEIIRGETERLRAGTQDGYGGSAVIDRHATEGKLDEAHLCTDQEDWKGHRLYLPKAEPTNHGDRGHLSAQDQVEHRRDRDCSGCLVLGGHA